MIATALDVTALLGTWTNTNPASKAIVRFDIQSDINADGDKLRVDARFESGGAATALQTDAFALDHFDGTKAEAFQATVTLDDREIRLQANIKGGVLVVALLTRFPDGSRNNYWLREFYYRSAR
ncbi:MAG TPA: hypothetical protein VGF48_25690 [Thermoanaerobaculia bacterium]|jgi:hypothetical protein